MIAITYGGQPEAIDWNRRGLELARSSTDLKARALIPAMLNNAAWDLHVLRRYEEALPLFREAEAEWTARKRSPQTTFASYAVGRCLRLLGRFAEAQKIQRTLEANVTDNDGVRGFVFEELGELLHATGQLAEAKSYFRRAHETLSRDEWLVKNEPARLARLEQLGR